MPTKLEPGEILARNPRIDPERLEKTREALRRLRELGLPRKGYEIAPPFRGRRAAASEQVPIEDPRLVRLISTQVAE